MWRECEIGCHLCPGGEVSVAESGGRLTNVISVGSGLEVWAGGRVPVVAGVLGWESASRRCKFRAAACLIGGQGR